MQEVQIYTTGIRRAMARESSGAWLEIPIQLRERYHTTKQRRLPLQTGEAIAVRSTRL